MRYGILNRSNHQRTHESETVGFYGESLGYNLGIRSTFTASVCVRLK